MSSLSHRDEQRRWSSMAAKRNRLNRSFETNQAQTKETFPISIHKNAIDPLYPLSAFSTAKRHACGKRTAWVTTHEAPVCCSFIDHSIHTISPCLRLTDPCFFHSLFNKSSILFVSASSIRLSFILPCHRALPPPLRRSPKISITPFDTC